MTENKEISKWMGSIMHAQLQEQQEIWIDSLKQR